MLDSKLQRARVSRGTRAIMIPLYILDDPDFAVMSVQACEDMAMGAPAPEAETPADDASVGGGSSSVDGSGSSGETFTLSTQHTNLVYVF